jgi:hypothetical protein
MASVKRSVTPANRRALIKGNLAESGPHPQGAAGNLHHHKLAGDFAAEQGGDPDHPLESDHPNFDRGSVRHAREDRGHPLLDKINMLDRSTHLVEHVPLR